MAKMPKTMMDRPAQRLVNESYKAAARLESEIEAWFTKKAAERDHGS